MALGTNINMMADMNAARAASVLEDRMRARNGNLENNLMNGLGLPQREHQYNYDRNERERDLNMCRSGSAPPTIEGSYNAIGCLFRNMDFANGGMSEDEMRSHPAYLSYYYSHDNINPRLPPPLLSKEEWRMHQRLRSGGLPLGVPPNWRKAGLVDGEGNSSLFSVQPGSLHVHKEENRNLGPAVVNSSNPSCQPSLWYENKETELVRSGAAGLGIRRKSFADILQEGYNQPTSLPGPIPRHVSRNLSYDFSNSSNFSFQPSELCSGLEAKRGQNSQVALGLGRVHNHNSLASSSFGTAVGSSLSRSSTPEVQILPSEERFFPDKMNKVSGSYASDGQSSSMNNLIESAACLSLAGLNNSQNGFKCQPQQGFVNNPNFQANMISVLHQHPIGDSSAQNLVSPSNHPSLTTTKANAARIRGFDEQNSYNNMRAPVAPNHAPGGYSINNKLIVGADNHLVSDSQFSVRCGKDVQLDNHFRVTDSADYQHPGHPAGQNHVLGGQYISSPHSELLGSHKAHLNPLISGQKQSYDLPLLPKGHGMNDGYYEGLAYLLGMQYGGTSIPNNLSAIQFGNSMLQNESFPNISSAMRNSIGGPVGSWKGDIPNTMKGRVAMTLLEEFKNNRTRPFELSEIVGHVVEFSMDQCGSRFIQQKLEIATNEEKMKIFPEITPHARALMTDVFGNYVIQKFFEHGTESQRKALASQVKTHVLPLSLQMYGCRVIQKALEVLDVDEKTKIVAELDGSVLKCVRDQNGNHVIQKCIECVPEDRIQFIISSFFGQVVPLSTHPYGCRVIQRILEHCSNTDTQKLIMAEIMQSICILAQDQYGNYVIQHVIQHGNPEERSVIITKLAGQIVKMSQQKFASNVIEKCLTYGCPEERQLIVKEMLGSTDENEPLQAMMKDPFGNYVVQKVLETCDEQTRELILSRIKLHLNALKKYTYVKHVVARVEKLLINAGETCTGPA